MQIATAASYAAVIVGKGFPSAWTGAPTRSLTGWPESLRGRSEFSVGIRSDHTGCELPIVRLRQSVRTYLGTVHFHQGNEKHLWRVLEFIQR
jgi:hypothetical protein